MQFNAKDLVAKVVTRAHQAIFDLSNGKIASRGMGMPVVKLTTTGRKSGKKRDTMLTSPLILDDGNVVLVASWGGDDRHPQWFLNVQEDPEVHLVVDGGSFDATARITEGAEREELWDRLTDAHDNYANYQTKTDREIPVLVCERH